MSATGWLHEISEQLIFIGGELGVIADLLIGSIFAGRWRR